MDRLRQDVIVSLRRLRKTPGFTISAILTLALGIGANTAIFTAVNTLIFRSLPVERPSELVSFNTITAKVQFPVQSYPNYVDFRDRNNVLSGLIGSRIVPLGFSRGGGDNARIWGYEITGNYFDVLGVSALRGRVIHPEDDLGRGAHPVAVISYGCWQRRFAADPDIAGKTMKINGMDYTVLGVAPKDFSGTEVVFTPEVWVPLSMEAQLERGQDWLDDRRNFNLFLMGRLKPGVTMPQAEAEINALAAEVGRQYPAANEGVKIRLSPVGLFGSFLRGTVHAFAAVLMLVAAMVLLIACVNLASLLLARAADRRKETAVRLALGASRSDLIRQLLTESFVLSIAGGVVGLLLAAWLADLFATWQPPIDVPVIPALSVDWRVMLFAGAISLVTALVFGLAPALQSVAADLAPALKTEAVADRLRSFHLRDVLVSAQVALSVILLVSSVLVVRSLQHALSLHLGLEPTGAATVAFDLGLQGYDETRSREFQRRVLERVRALPGVSSAGIIDGLPMSLNWNNSTIFLEGKPVPRASDATMAAMYQTSPGYFRAAGTRMIAGRDFDDGDKRGGRRAGIVNQAFVRQLLPGENPLGKRFRTESNEGEWIDIVGVVEDGKYRSLGEVPMPAVFEPIAQHQSWTTTIVARSSMPEDQLAGMLRRAVLDLDSSISLFQAGSLTDQLGLVLFPARVAASVLGAFGLLAVVLAATGVYGIMAYAVSRRTREIGIRMALGAKSSQVLRAMLSRTALLVSIGAAAGLALSLAGGRLFAQILYGISARDPLTYAVSIALMALVAFTACWFPARRAIKINPVTALRTE